MEKKTDDNDKNCLSLCLTTRRQFLLSSGLVTAGILLSDITGLGMREVEAVVAKYPRRKIGKVSSLKQDTPVVFSYPNKDIRNILIKLGVPAGAGVGKQNDIVAFNPVCTHMGGTLDKLYHPDCKVLGQCPLHLSTFDLTRHGIIISGHATQSLPQIELEVSGDDIYATGVIGLAYGRNSNV